MNNGQLDKLDIIALFTTVLNVLDYTELLKQASNNDLLKELKHQNTDYMEKILEGQKEIINLLKGVE